MSRNYKIHDQQGVYFITFTIVSWIDVFTRPLYKDLFLESVQYCQENKGFKVHAYCIMTNHVHFIANAEDNRLSDIIRDLKKFTSKKIINEIDLNVQESRKAWMMAIFRNAGAYNRNNEQYQFWQQHNHPIELYSGPVIQQKLDYIHNNPVAAGYVVDAENYPYSSAHDYAGGKGKLKIDLLY